MSIYWFDWINYNCNWINYNCMHLVIKSASPLLILRDCYMSTSKSRFARIWVLSSTQVAISIDTDGRCQFHILDHNKYFKYCIDSDRIVLDIGLMKYNIIYETHHPPTPTPNYHSYSPVTSTIQYTQYQTSTVYTHNQSTLITDYILFIEQ